jgi:hypothetical protein
VARKGHNLKRFFCTVEFDLKLNLYASQMPAVLRPHIISVVALAILCSG